MPYGVWRTRDLVENLITADVILHAVKDLTQFSAFARVYQTLRSAQGDKLGFSSGLLEVRPKTAPCFERTGEAIGCVMFFPVKRAFRLIS